MSGPRLLWVGDAVMATGFAKCTHAACDAFHAAGWDVNVLGINYLGDPHDYPYKIYPAARPFRADDAFGERRAAVLTKELKPDLVVFLNDPWNIPPIVESVRAVDKTVPLVGYLAVDGKNCQGKLLSDLNLAIFWTRFGAEEARLGGYAGPSEVVPLGVDTTMFCPGDRSEARRRLEFPPHLMDGFVIGCVGRNQPRKRLDLMVSYFADWVKNYDVPNARLMFHVAPTGDLGWNIPQLVRYYGLQKRTVIFIPEIGMGVEERVMPYIYRAMNAHATATQGEGWGLCTMEAMACGIANVVPDAAALGEWPEDTVIKVKCSEIAHTPNNINVMGALPDRHEMIKAFHSMYQNQQLCETYGKWGRELVSKPHFSWKAIGERFVDVVESNVMQARARVA